MLVFNLVPNKVVSMKGEKIVIVKTMGKEKIHCTVLLGILTNGSKLPPLIVFKRNKEGKLCDKYLKNNKVLIYFNAQWKYLGNWRYYATIGWKNMENFV